MICGGTYLDYNTIRTSASEITEAAENIEENKI